MYEAETWLDHFARQADSGPFDVPYVHHHPAAHGEHVVFAVAVHGDEIGPLPAAVRLIEALGRGTLETAGPVTVIVGNPEAVRAGQRAVHSDLNRAWAFAEERGVENERARQLRPVFDSADLFVDFHQTALATRSAFWTMPWRSVYGQWARAIGAAPLGLTRAPDQVFASPLAKCIDEYVRDRGRIGITVEVGQRGFDPTQEQIVTRAMHRTLELAGAEDLAAIAEACAPIRWHRTVHREPWGAHRLRPGIANWQPVREGEQLSEPGAPALFAPADGVILFPKYPAPETPTPAHLFHLAQALDGSPDAVFPENDPA